MFIYVFEQQLLFSLEVLLCSYVDITDSASPSGIYFSVIPIDIVPPLSSAYSAYNKGVIKEGMSD